MAAKLHIEHLEDYLLHEGNSGFQKILKILSQIPKNEIELTTKIDGKPAIIFGRDPETNKFFIGTKKAITTPAFSTQDINEIYEGELKEILTNFFNELSLLSYENFYMGDAMFWPGVKQQDGENISFKPNTIEYIVSKDSPIGVAIGEKEYGIVVHTEFIGETIKSASKQPIKIKLPSTNNLWVGDVTYQPTTTLDFSGVDFSILETAKSFNFDGVNEALGKYKTKILSYLVKQSKEQFTVDREFIENMKMFLLEQYKSEKEKSAINNLFNEIMNAKLIRYFNIYKSIATIKNQVIQILEKSSPLKTKIAGEPSGGEGFVTQCDGSICKLVDRYAFSRMNFMHNEEYLFEGGNLFDDTEPIKKDDVLKIVKEIQQKAQAFIGATPTPVGSTGRKEFSGDIDLMFDTSELSEHNDEKEAMNKLIEFAKQLNAPYKKGGLQLSISYPYFKAGESKHAHVDFMFGRKDWSTRIKDMDYDTSDFKGVDKNIMLAALLKLLTFEVTEGTEQAPITYTQYTLDFNRGLQKVKKTLRSTTNPSEINKNPKVIERQLIPDSMNYLIELLSDGLNKKLTEKDINTFEKLVQLTKSLSFVEKEEIKEYILPHASDRAKVEQYLKKHWS